MVNGKARKWWLAWLGLGALAAALAGGCNSVLDIEQGHLTPATECVHHSDCAGDLVCLFQVCSEPCQADKDCPDGERCLRGDDQVGCVAIGATSCESDDDCPAGAPCSDGTCRNACSDELPCLADQQCQDGACRGTDSAHDDSPTSPGDASTPMVVSDAGTQSTPDGGMGGDSCEEGTTRCEGMAQTARSKCVGGKWQTIDACEDGSVCDTSTGDCAKVLPECVGKMPGEGFCDGATRIVCGPDLVTKDDVECDSIQLCQAGSGADCAVCLDNEYLCSNQTLQKCNDTHSGFDDVETCTEADPCNADAGACTHLACLPDQKRCNGDVLEQCNDDQSAFAELETCGTGLCDNTNFECDICVPDSASCQDGDTRLVCSSDGQTESMPDCTGTKNVCTGAGVCVECTTDNATNCTATNACYTAGCNTASGDCTDTPKARGTACNFASGSHCDGAGACVECTANAHCTATNACYTASCTDDACDEQPKSANTACSFSGGQYCDGAGDCVECNGDGQCTATNACYTTSCSSHSCTEQAKAPGTACSFDGGAHCNNGACVECVNDTHCPPDGGQVSDTLCRSGSCIDPVHYEGWSYPGGTALTSITSNTSGAIFWFQLPALAHDATLLTFGVHGAGTGSNLKMALYDDGASNQPGAVLAETVSPIGLFNGRAEVNASPGGVSLTAGKKYWIAYKPSATASIYGGSSGGALGWIDVATYSDTSWPTFSSGSASDNNNIHRGVFIKVEDTE